MIPAFFTRHAANKSATKNTLNILVTSIEITNEIQTTNKVINLASSDFFLRISREIVDAIAFSKVSILDVTRRVAKDISNTIVRLFKSNCSMKLNAGDSKPFPAPTAPPIPRRRIVKNAPIPEKMLAFLIAFEFSAEKVLCQYPIEKTSAAVTAIITANADFRLKVSKEFNPPAFAKVTNSERLF